MGRLAERRRAAGARSCLKSQCGGPGEYHTILRTAGLACFIVSALMPRLEPAPLCPSGTTLSTNDCAQEPDERSHVTEADRARTDHPAATPTALQFFLICSRIGLTSFGGGLSGWFMREFVHDRHWLSEEEFLNGLALSQALPGVNIKNLAIWIGHRLLGWRGAVAGFCGIIFPPAVFIVVLGAFFSAISGFSLTHIALAGAAAGAIGLSLSMAITAVRRLPRRVVPLVVFIATFIAVAIFALPLVWTVLIAGTVSVAHEYVRLARGE